MNKILELVFDRNTCTLVATLSVWGFLLILLVIVVVIVISRVIKSKNKIPVDVIPVSMKYSMGGAEIEYSILRDYTNIEIAHRIYIELITRKAAVPIDETNDVIIEVYNSWYALFQVIRDEAKKVTGKMLRDQKSTRELIKLLTDLLNCGLRPHLTEYQALFRKWYTEEIGKKENLGRTPQEIQRDYKEYGKLIESLKDVNVTVVQYTKQLLKIVEGK